MSRKDFLRNILFNKPQEKETKSQRLIKDLFTIPKKPKGVEIRHYIKPTEEGQQQQADILYLPSDTFGYKYCLVVVDIADNRIDVEPLKQHSASAVENGFIKIYSRGILQKPIYLNVDAGSEFKGNVLTYLKENNIIPKVSATARHSQTAFVEYINKLIGKAVGYLQTEQELKKNKTVKGWLKYIRDIVETINEQADKNQEKNESKNDKNQTDDKKMEKDAVTGNKMDETIDSFIDDIKNKKETPILKKDVPLLGESYIKQGGILDIGTKVRYQLDYPISAGTNKRLHGDKFRAGDIRWSKEIYTIDKAIIVPNQPISYLINGITNRSFLRQQLQVIHS